VLWTHAGYVGYGVGTFTVRCIRCPMDAAPVLTAVAAIEDAEAAVLRQHLRAAHSEVRLPVGLGDLLTHFTVEQASGSS